MSHQERAVRKIFPRNLTARADHDVVGNPSTTRPESAADNSYPGLEFDQRNLEERFFPGLVFYFHRLDGACLVRTPLEPYQRDAGLKKSDLRSKKQLYLWGLLGRHSAGNTEPSMMSFQGQPGMEVWRRVRNLLPGPIAILLGEAPPNLSTLPHLDKLWSHFREVEKAEPIAGICPFSFNIDREEGRPRVLVLADRRSDYVTDEGVIDPELFRPGDLSKTMCSPWMYDFRDCFCFFWAASKPDIADVIEGGVRYRDVNFVRNVVSRGSAPTIDTSSYILKRDETGPVYRSSLELSHFDMLAGWWERLPIVLQNREQPDGALSVAPNSAATRFSLEEVAQCLTYLATVEHALAVQYLYAFYSVPRHGGLGGLPVGERRTVISTIAKDLFAIAVDEMRHFMWVNRCLAELKAGPSLGRALTIGAPTKDRTRLLASNSDVTWTFSLRIFSKAAIEIFREIEAPSKQIHSALDGMYVHILESLTYWHPSCSVIPIIKLLIDEGHDHWERFSIIKEIIDTFEDEELSISLLVGPPSAFERKLIQLSDLYYHVILDTIGLSTTVSPRVGAKIMSGGIKMMHNLHEIAQLLSERGFLPLFSLDDTRQREPSTLEHLTIHSYKYLDESGDHLPNTFKALSEFLNSLQEMTAEPGGSFAGRHFAAVNLHLNEVQANIRFERSNAGPPFNVDKTC